MSIVKYESLESKLVTINNDFVLLDKDAALIYGVEAKKSRQQLKRNIDKFPKTYAYQLDDTQVNILVSQNVTPLQNKTLEV